jgi:hypothetical protein
MYASFTSIISQKCILSIVGGKSSLGISSHALNFSSTKCLFQTPYFSLAISCVVLCCCLTLPSCSMSLIFWIAFKKGHHMSICELCYLLRKNCIGIVVVSSNNDSKHTICSLSIRASIIVVVSIQKHIDAMLSPFIPI